MYQPMPLNQAQDLFIPSQTDHNHSPDTIKHHRSMSNDFELYLNIRSRRIT